MCIERLEEQRKEGANRVIIGKFEAVEASSNYGVSTVLYRVKRFGATLYAHDFAESPGTELKEGQEFYFVTLQDGSQVFEMVYPLSKESARMEQNFRDACYNK